jgi:hypothetical protein
MVKISKFTNWSEGYYFVISNRAWFLLCFIGIFFFAVLVRVAMGVF